MNVKIKRNLFTLLAQLQTYIGKFCMQVLLNDLAATGHMDVLAPEVMKKFHAV
jgi:hypothetical protein